MKKNILIVIVFVAVGFYIGFTGVERGNITDSDCFITLNNERFDLDLAKTPAERAKGLSGTGLLPAGTGKLFVFDTLESHGFWMKDMNYPIDIIWFDQNMYIVGISKNLAPNTYPKVFYPDSLSLYTLEVNAGVADQLNLNSGTRAQLNCKAI
jgi:uncharacterized membrane protein (UPF0127 family)